MHRAGRAAGLEVLVVDQTHPDIGLPVARVICPGLLHHVGPLERAGLLDVLGTARSDNVSGCFGCFRGKREAPVATEAPSPGSTTAVVYEEGPIARAGRYDLTTIVPFCMSMPQTN